MYSVDQLAIPSKVREALKQAHYANLEVRVNGELLTFEADWLKEYAIYGPQEPRG